MHFEDVYQSKWLRASDLKDQQKAFTIERVAVGEVGQGADKKTQLILTFIEADKPLGLNKTNAKAIAGIFGPDSDDWVGETLVLFPTQVDYQGSMVDAIRVNSNKTREHQQAKFKQAKAAAAKPAAKPKAVTQAEIDAEIGPDASEDIEIPF